MRDSARPTVRQALARCAPGEVIAARRGRRPVALVVLEDGRAFTVPDACPHDGGLLSDGFVDGDHLVCARHGWEFEVPGGRCPGRAGVCVPIQPVARVGRRRRRPAQTWLPGTRAADR
jgi:nitrite reductase/ring-hydroxylating ferredoxin subunit